MPSDRASVCASVIIDDDERRCPDFGYDCEGAPLSPFGSGRAREC
jgi:hypothetical protein